MFAVRGFKVGTAVEAAFERGLVKIGQAIQQPKQPDPKLETEKIQAQAEQQRTQAEMQMMPLEMQASKSKQEASIIKSKLGVQKAIVQSQQAAQPFVQGQVDGMTQQ